MLRGQSWGRRVALCVLLGACGRVGFERTDDSATQGTTIGFFSNASLVDEASGTVRISVVLSTAATGRVSVHHAITGGTATRDVDYTATDGDLVFEAGESVLDLEISIVPDSLTEVDETIELTLSSSSGAVLDQRSHTITISATSLACVGAGAYEVCPATLPSAPITLTPTIDTDTSPLCASAQPAGWTVAGQPPSCFVIATRITMTSNVSVTGTRPLVLVATDTIDVSAQLDVASHPGTSGPGSPSNLCAGFPSVPGGDSDGGGGGAGGTFMSRGGGGGLGATAAPAGTSPVAGAAPMLLRAGCDGQPGGSGNVLTGSVGRGGGGAYLAARSTITISGSINASGSGGIGGGNSSGGSGGGGGGMIKLFAASITAAGGTLIANGGGGASGASDGAAAIGASGADPAVATPLLPAAGGADANGGDGGAGVVGGLNAGTGGGGAANGGGGGGGGGGGYIESNRPLVGATVSGGRYSSP